MTTTGPLICDTSGLLALADASDPDHEVVAAAVDDATGPFILSPLVLAELDHLLRTRSGAQAARDFAGEVAAGSYELAPLTAAGVAACLDVDRRYAQLGLGLADAHLVVLADTYRSLVLLTLDERHFRAVRPLRGRRFFSLLPADR
ncbi:MAG: PIN domain-containing protein [Mycobacteriales bacterium]